jgi:hypothetical protein
MVLVCLFTVFWGTCAVGEATELNGFLGIPWGTSREGVRQAMEKDGYSFYKEEDLGNIKHQIYENGPYARYNVYLADAMFKYDAMYFGGVMIKAPSGRERELFFIYNDLKKLLQDKYGEPQQEKQEWELKIGPSTGVTVTRATWKIPNGDKSPHTITLTLTPAFYAPGDKRQWGNAVDVAYKNEALEKELDEREKDKI